MNKLFHIIAFSFFYIKEVLVSNFRVAIVVLNPKSQVEPGIVPVPIKTLGDNGTVLLANLISMTPGTLSVEWEAEEKRLWIHNMDLPNEQAFIDQIIKNYETPISKFLTS